MREHTEQPTQPTAKPATRHPMADFVFQTLRTSAPGIERMCLATFALSIGYGLGEHRSKVFLKFCEDLLDTLVAMHPDRFEKVWIRGQSFWGVVWPDEHLRRDHPPGHIVGRAGPQATPIRMILTGTDGQPLTGSPSVDDRAR